MSEYPKTNTNSVDDLANSLTSVKKIQKQPRAFGSVEEWKDYNSDIFKSGPISDGGITRSGAVDSQISSGTVDYVKRNKEKLINRGVIQEKEAATETSQNLSEINSMLDAVLLSNDGFNYTSRVLAESIPVWAQENPHMKNFFKEQIVNKMRKADFLTIYKRIQPEGGVVNVNKIITAFTNPETNEGRLMWTRLGSEVESPGEILQSAFEAYCNSIKHSS